MSRIDNPVGKVKLKFDGATMACGLVTFRDDGWADFLDHLRGR